MKSLKDCLYKLNQNTNNEIILTRSIFLRLLSVIYLFAFLSIYFQIQGLFGDEGIFPAKNLLQIFVDKNKDKANISFFTLPTLLWYSDYIASVIAVFPYFGYFSNVENTMYILCIIGIFAATSILLNYRILFNMYGFFIMWIIYLNFYLVGQSFFSYQWDLLLLETGFLAFLFAPTTKETLIKISVIDDIIYHLLKFLLFRFVFAFGIIAYTSTDPFWQNFNVLTVFFQSQPLPNFQSWVFHNLINDGVKRMLLAFMLFIEVRVKQFYLNFIRCTYPSLYSYL